VLYNTPLIGKGGKRKKKKYLFKDHDISHSSSKTHPGEA
jgi:hypothetical protein